MAKLPIEPDFPDLSTPLIADAALRLEIPLRLAPPGVRPLKPGMRLAGRALPARHYGSVDIFLEAMEGARGGEVLVVDNQGRLDEGPVGDLIVLEALAAGLAGVVIWGANRDTPELLEIGLPVFSYGAYPSGPVRLDPREPDALARAGFGAHEVTGSDVVFADDDGVIFAPLARAEDLLSSARAIRDAERRQAEAVRGGRTLRDQLQFADYLRRRAEDPAYTFRKHLRRIGGAIEE